MDKVLLILVIILVLSITARLTPTLASQTVFSLDTWPLIRDTEVVLREGANIYNGRSLSGYHNHWPGIILFVLVLSQLTGIDPETLYALPMTVTLSFILVVSILVFLKNNKITPRIKILTTIAMLSFPSLLVFTSAPLKEVYSLPLFLLILSYVLNHENQERYELVILIVMFLGMVISHNLSPYILIGSMITMLFYSYSNWLKKGLNKSVVKTELLVFLAASVVIYVLYNIAQYNAFVRLGAADILTPSRITIFIIVFSLFYLTLFLVNIGRLLKTLIIVLIMSLVILLAMTGNVSKIVPGLNYPLSISGLLISITLFIGLLLAVFPGEEDQRITYSFSILFFITLNIVYILLFAPLLSTILHRFLNYLIIPITLSSIYLAKKTLTVRFLLFIFLALSITASTILIYETVTDETPLTYHWYYTQPEVYGLKEIEHYLSENFTVVGDDKITYYFTDIQRTSTSELLGFLAGNRLNSGELLVVYNDNYKYGFVVNTNIYKVYIHNKTIQIQKIYSNNKLEAYTQ